MLNNAVAKDIYKMTANSIGRNRNRNLRSSHEGFVDINIFIQSIIVIRLSFDERKAKIELREIMVDGESAKYIIFAWNSFD